MFLTNIIDQILVLRHGLVRWIMILWSHAELDTMVTTTSHSIQVMSREYLSPGFSFDVSGDFVQKKNLFLENVTLSDEESATVNYSHLRVALKIHNGFFYGFEQLVRHLHSIGFTIDALDLKRTTVDLSDLRAAVDLLRGSLQLVNIKNISFNQPSGTLDLSNVVIFTSCPKTEKVFFYFLNSHFKTIEN